MEYSYRRNIFGKKVSGHTILESIIALSLISIVLSIGSLIYSNLLNSVDQFSEIQLNIEQKNERLDCIYTNNCNQNTNSQFKFEIE